MKQPDFPVSKDALLPVTAWTTLEVRPARARNGQAQKRGGIASLRTAVQELLRKSAAARRDADVDFVLEQFRKASCEGIAVVGRDGRIAYASASLCRLLGHSRERLLGQPAADYLGALYGTSPVDPSGRDSYEMHLRTETGSRRVAKVSAQRITTSRGKLIGSLAVLADVTERADAEAALRRSESDLRLMSAQLLASQELERQRIARELHDGIGQALGGVKCSLELCESVLEKGDAEGAQRKMRELGNHVRAIVDEVRRIAMDLRPSTLDDLGVLATLGWLSREFRAVYAHVDLQTIVEVCEDEIAPPAKTALYRITQEALHNVVTHARARNVALAIRRNGSHIELQISDDGIGFDPARFSTVEKSGRGLGLASMRERAEASGGRYHLRSGNGSGTTISVSWPTHCPRDRERGGPGNETQCTTGGA